MKTKPTRLIILDFDGTLAETRESIEQTIQLTFNALLPSHQPCPTEIHRLITAGTGLLDTLTTLHPDPAVFQSTQQQWLDTFVDLYATQGQLLIQPFPGARELLVSLKERNIPTAIVSNKTLTALRTALQRNGLDEFVPAEMVIGNGTPGAQRKPHPSSYVDVLLPIVKERFGVKVEEEEERGEGMALEVLVVGDTVADILFAKNIGARVCWCRFGDGDRDMCMALEPDFVVDGLEEVLGVLEGDIDQ